MAYTELHHRQSKLSRRGFLGLTGLTAAGLLASCSGRPAGAYYPSITWRTAIP